MTTQQKPVWWKIRRGDRIAQPSGVFPGARRSGDGFLLVEALATMAISAFLLVAMASVVSLALRASQRAEQTSQEIEDTSRTLAALMRDIRQIAPLRWAGEGADFVFDGAPDRISFARAVSLPDGSSDSRIVTLRSDGFSLVEEERALPPAATGPQDLDAAGTHDVLQQRYRVAFAYFARLDTGQELLTDSWDRRGFLPVAVRVSLIDRQGAVRGSVRVPTLVDAEPGCAAPGKALCSFVPVDGDGGDQAPPVAADIDPDDALGWERYLRP